MFEVLMFLFENYMDENVILKMDDDSLVVELERIGFNRNEISKALDWLDGLAAFQASFSPKIHLATHAIRHYSAQESQRLGVEGKGLLLCLEQAGIVDAMTRETVLDRIMALDPREVDLGHIKWVVLMALFNQPDKKTALSLMQDMVLSEGDVLH